LAVGACKAELASGPEGTDPDASVPGADPPTPVDAAPDAAPLGPWTAQKLLGASSATLSEDDVTLAPSALELVFAVSTSNGKDLYSMTRPSLTGAWTTPALMSINVATATDETPRFSADALTLYFTSSRTGNQDFYRTRRAAVGAAWGTPELVPGVSTAGIDKWLAPCAVGNTYLAIVDNDVYEGTFGTQPTRVAALSSAASETGTFLSPDCLTAYFASTRANNKNQLYYATRPAIGGTWSAPALVNSFSAVGGDQEDPWIAGDLRTFAFASDVSGTKDVYLATR
jgi:hypothetical protein